MSWDADFTDEFGLVREWNYTHNTSPMIYKVLEVLDANPAGERWWWILGTKNGTEGAEFLDQIIHGLMEAPELFRSMNPANGWGNYDQLLGVLVEMRDHSRIHPNGKWETSG